MISLKRYLESETPRSEGVTRGLSYRIPLSALLWAYRGGLAEMGDGGASACPDLGAELKKGLTRVDEGLGEHPDLQAVAHGDRMLCERCCKAGDKRPRSIMSRKQEK